LLCAHDPVHKPRATANEALTQTKPHRARCRDRSAHRNKVPWRSKSWTRARLSECIGHDDLINCGRPLRRCPSRAVAPYRRHRVGRSHATSEVSPPHMAHPVEGRDQPHQTLLCTSAGSAHAQMQTLPAQTSSPQRSHHRDQAEHWDHTRAATRVRSVPLWPAMTGPANPCRALQCPPRECALRRCRGLGCRPIFRLWLVRADGVVG
jgi:hypothetical protein